MPKLVPFSQHEAVLLLDAYLETLGSNQSRQQIVQRVSNDLRNMATNQGIEIDDVYRNTNGISFQMASMESAYKGQTIMKPATRLFTETVRIYREERVKYDQILKEAKSMVVNKQTTEKAFASWLSEKVSPPQLSKIWNCYHDIEAFCRKIGVLKQPLFLTTDLDAVKRVQKTVSQNKIFTVTHRKTIKSIILAAQYYTEFVKEHAEREASRTDIFANAAPAIPAEEELTVAIESNSNSQVQDNVQKTPEMMSLQARHNATESNSKKTRANASTICNVQQILEENNIPCFGKSQFYVFVEIDALTNTVRNILNQQASDLVSITRFVRNDKECWRINLTGEKRTGNSQDRPAEKMDSQKNSKKPKTAPVSSDGEPNPRANVVTEQHSTTNAAPRERQLQNSDQQYEERYPSLYSKLLAASKVYDDPSGLSLDRICSILNTNEKIVVEEILSHVSWATKITIGVYSFSKNIPAVLDQLSSTETERIVKPDDYSKDRFIEVLMQRYRNGMMFDSIDFDIFRETYEMLFEERLSFDDLALEARIRNCGILYKDRLFPANGIIDPETKKKLFEYIDGCFASGKTVLYYKAIFADLASELASCYTLADEEMLRAYIEYTAEKGKYYLTEKYLSVEKNVVVDHNAEVADYLLSAGKPMSTDNVCDTLSHIPGEQIRRIITTDTRFLRNSKGEYFHEDIFEISEAELEEIAEIINEFIQQNEYAIWTDVWNEIQDKMPEFLENNLYLSGLGIRNVLAKHLDGRFNFEGAVISMPKDRYAMRDIYQLYAKHHAEFTANDIYNLSRELDTVIYFEPLAEVSVRVSLNRFVSKELIQFDVDAVDKAIGSFVSKEYIRIREIDSYLVFPNVGYEWNEYLLESFVYSYSKKFSLLHNGFSLYNVAGAVVKKSGAIQEFVDACAAVLADAPISLTKNEALNYLADANMITRRSYRDLDMAIKKATQIRDRKG